MKTLLHRRSPLGLRGLKFLEGKMEKEKNAVAALLGCVD